MDKLFYVTTPIYYVNAEPHIGHAYSTILADFQARFHRMLGEDVYFLTGTDEHGDKIAEAAKNHNSTPQEYTDRISGKFKDAWKEIGISNNDFIRTTEERHKKVVAAILQKVYDAGDIYFGSYGGNYCTGCERFLTETELVDGKCPDHNKPPVFIEEKNYFFRMSKYQGWLLDYINANPDFIRPERYRNEVLSLLKSDALEDLCISRPTTRLTWGIHLPFDNNYVAYVWVDALVNYISALGYPDGEKFARYWPSVQHITAKDILKQHGIFWPTMLKAAGIEPYKHLNVHGYWNMEGLKMSKSLGNVVTPKSLMDKFGNDQVRYFLMREMNFGSDARFSEETIISRINYDLGNDLGNLVNRTLNMARKFFDGKVPAFEPSHNAGRDELSEKLANAIGDYVTFTSSFQTSIGLEKLWEFVRFLNKYIDDRKPWALAKDGATHELASVMRNLLESIYGIAYLLSPLLVEKSPLIIKALGGGKTPANVEELASLNFLSDGNELGDPGILFPRMEMEKAPEPEAPKQKEKETPKKEPVPKEEDTVLLDIKDFTRVDIRVAQVLSAERVEGSDKLLELKVDSGLDQRTIIAGIAQAYSPEDITGKKFLLVANLKPATIFKRQSQGMLLAAKQNPSDKPRVVFVDDAIPTGSRLG